MKKNYRSGYIRIIGGQWRRHKLPVLNSIGLQPTTDRIRETLFNWLNPIIKNSNCLDCFTGSGALGFESLSRYANFVTMLESNITVVKQLQKNLKFFNVSNSEIIKTNTLFWLKQKGRPFDIVFIDPPFDSDFISETMFLLDNNGWLSDHALIYIESKKIKMVNIPYNWILYKKNTAGKVVYCLYRIKK
ncbi:16S rRNA (guanine(966)-N(2))-methyltransferase RsmD [Candidatus Pantoea edessiphila]|uniref:Ribosomal RNA small subunit methyltransferase D n=1 Tax=Candidatus Pantoea edessiphila TaxID=2044610 RepID=A0A2P5SXX4_9GAMM|nr:16S rRNA (guanine(966)-N(2))-methyltransferase RsmD [Candidatus Pantoea edessiphila]MBK4775757.1 16S rRNA (guanine(966)-N(2))-methyltransferase RsmD [Pantoea sp. Edef]PPI87153.1 16S rRNA (guanine(966)-N(2))-methyltransferase RsmD [Candidatus Pantoea edessiphila]